MKYWIVCLLVVVLSSCKEKYEETIDAYVKERFYDPSSYERISLGEPVKNDREVRVYHLYRAKGVKGVVLSEDVWVLDKSMNKIIDIVHHQTIPYDNVDTGVMLYP